MAASSAPPRRVDRYLLCGEIASGGMATVYFGRHLGPLGFSRTVALKRLHPAYVKDANFVAMLLDEARLASRVRHPNVVQVLDVVASGGELILALEYIHGMALVRLMEAARRAGNPPPPAVASAIIADVLRGLHAAHEARTETGQPLELIHRDISPQNILVHQDGMTLVTDFGIARATGRLQKTREGELKGKPAYMAPEQLRGETITRRVDGFATGIVLWETLTGQRLFAAENELGSVRKVLAGPIDPPSRVHPGVPEAVDEVVLRALARNPAERYATAAEMQHALEQALPPAPTSAVAAWVKSLAGEKLLERAREIQRIESEPAEKLLAGEAAAVQGAIEPLVSSQATPAADDLPVEEISMTEVPSPEDSSPEPSSPEPSSPEPSSPEVPSPEDSSPEPSSPEPSSPEPSSSQPIAEPTAMSSPPRRTPAPRQSVLSRAAPLVGLVGAAAGLLIWLGASATQPAALQASAGMGRVIAVFMLSQAAADALAPPPTAPAEPAPVEAQPAEPEAEPAASASAQGSAAPAPSETPPAKPRTGTKKPSTKTTR